MSDHAHLKESEIQPDPEAERLPLILRCSPRANGNCDKAASIVRSAFDAAHKRSHMAEYLVLSRHTLAPCVACNECKQPFPHRPCPLSANDDAPFLFSSILAASSLVIVAPIYFYHLPAHLKALVDRSQPWWWAQEQARKNGVPPPKRLPAWAILVGARAKGDKLFEGATLTLRYWLDTLGFELAPPLTLNGLDGPTALAKSPEHLAKVEAYAARIARQAAATAGNAALEDTD